MENGKFSMRLRANVGKFGFSLVELMISLIVISIVTAAFAPVLTKKLKTSDQSIGTATAVSITSSAVCNSVSKGCIECENDKCLAPADGYFLNESTGKSQHCNSVITGCAQCDSASKCTKSEDGYFLNGTNTTKCIASCSTCTGLSTCTGCNSGYWLNGSSCTACSVQNAACQTCSNGATCTKCSENYVLSGGKCAACPNHCKSCTGASVCTTCHNGYFLNQNKACFKYTCDSLLCYLTRNNDTVLTLYRYNIGDMTFAMPAGINTCYIGSSCPYGSFTPICWRANVALGQLGFTNPPEHDLYGVTSYKQSGRTSCNWYAAKIAEQQTGWKLPNFTNFADFNSLIYGMENYDIPTDPFCTPAFKGRIPLCSSYHGVWIYPRWTGDTSAKNSIHIYGSSSVAGKYVSEQAWQCFSVSLIK